MRNSIHPLWHSIKRFSSPSPHNPASPPLSTHSSNTNKASKRYKRVSTQSLSDNSKWPLSSSPNSLPLGSKMVTIKIYMKIFSKSILFYHMKITRSTCYDEQTCPKFQVTLWTVCWQWVKVWLFPQRLITTRKGRL